MRHKGTCGGVEGPGPAGEDNSNAQEDGHHGQEDDHYNCPCWYLLLGRKAWGASYTENKSRGNGP